MRFPEFSGEWKVCRIRDILSIKHGRDYKNEPNERGLYPVLGTGGKITKIDSFLCDWDCACIGRKGTINRPIYMNSPFWCVDTLFYSKPHSGENPKFQYYLFKTINWVLYNEASGVPSLSASTIENIRVNIPDIDEQNKLVRFFSLIDEKISKQHELVELLKSYKRGLLSKVFPKKDENVPEIRFDGFTDNWEQRKVTELGEIYIGLVTTMTSHYTDHGALLIRNSDIKDGRFEFGDNPIYLDDKFAKQNASRKHKVGDVITVHTGDIGTSAVITEKEAGSIGFATIVTRPDKEKITSEYLCAYLNTDTHKNFAMNISTGDGRNNYNLKDYYECVVPVPSVAEQKKISSFIEGLNNLITLHQRNLNLNIDMKKSLLKEMFI